MSSPKHRAELHWRTWVITALAVVAIVGIAAAVAGSGAFRASQLTVSGNDALTVDDVLAAGGLSDRTNLVYFSPGATQGRLETHPWIDEAVVTRTLPNTLDIQIEERIPAAVTTRSGTITLIATDGTSLAVVRTDDGLPVIRGVRPGALGEAPDPMRGPAAVAAAFGESVLEQRPVIDVGAGGQIEIELKKGVPVTYGDAAQPEEKALAIAGILAWADEERADIISMDVRVPYSPTAVLERGGEQLDSGIIPISTDPCATQDDDEQTASPVPPKERKPERETPNRDARCLEEQAKKDRDRSDEPDDGGAVIP